jgi:hypothetical protein
LALDRGARLATEELANTIVVTRRWNALGIRQMLAQKDKLNSDAVCDRVLSRTSGWHSLIEEVVSSCGAHHDPRIAADRVRLEFEGANSSRSREFLVQFAFQQYPEANAALRLIARESPIPQDLVIELLAGEFVRVRVEDALTYLSRMDCVDVSDGGYTVEPILRDQVLSVSK